MDKPSAIRVTVAYSPGARDVREWALDMAAGTTVAQALAASGIAGDFPDFDIQQASLGVWGNKAAPDRALRDGDRVEVYRPLLVDPKLARRERFRKQGARAAGLFAKRRAGAKPGY